MDLQRVAGFTRQPRAGLEQVAHGVGRDQHHFSVLERYSAHVGGLMAVHARIAAELAGANVAISLAWPDP